MRPFRYKSFYLMTLSFILLVLASFVPFAYTSFAAEGRTIYFSGDEDEIIRFDRALQQAFDKIGYYYTVEAQSISAAMLSANNGESDGLIARQAGLEQEYPNLVMIPEPLATLRFQVYTPINCDRKFSKWSDLSGLTVGYLYNKPYISSNLPADIKEEKNYTDLDLMFKALKDGEIEAAVYQYIDSGSVITGKHIRNAGYTDEIQVYTYLNKKNSGLLDKLTESIRQMKDDGSLDKIIHNSPKYNNDENNTVLYLSSYTSDMQWEYELLEGLKSNNSTVSELDIHNISINSLRHTNNKSHIKAVGNSIRREFLESPPRLIIVSDDEALQYLKSVYHIYFYDVPVVYFGVNDYNPEFIDGYEWYFTGLFEFVSADDTVELALKLFPDTNKVFIIHDYSVSGQNWRNTIYNQLKHYEDSGRLQLEYSENIPFDELLKTLSGLDENTIILSGFYMVDSTGRYYLGRESQTKLYEHANAPIFGLISTDLGYGEFGGKYTDAKTQGKQAHVLADKILSGIPVSSIPAQSTLTDTNIWMFDYNILSEWGIRQSSLPKGAVIINQPANIIYDNPILSALVILLFVVAIAVIISLTYFITAIDNKNKALIEMQKNLHTAEELLVKDKLIEEVKQQRDEVISAAPILFAAVLADGEIIDCNKYAQNELGMKIGLNIKDFYSDPLSRTPIIDKLMRQIFLEGEVIRFKIKSGEYHSFHNNISYAEYDGRRVHVTWGIDIENLVAQNDIITRSQSDLQRVLDSLPIPFAILNIHSPHYPVYVNTAYLELFEFGSFEEAIQYSIADISPEYQPTNEKSSVVMSQIDKLFSHEKNASFEWQFKLKNGRIIDAVAKGSEILYKNTNTLGFIIQDIGLEKLQSKMLLDKAEQEREANQMKSRFVVNMSHEIRTPMNAIIGLSEIALMKNHEREAHDAFRKINMSSKNLLSIINDVLDFSKIEAEKLELIEEDFLLDDVLSNAVMIGVQRLDKKPVEISLKVAPDVPQYLYGDKTRLWQILKNLLDNSAKFTSTGQIILEVSFQKTDDINISEITFIVSDTGLGMSEAQLSKLFTPFEQFHQNSTNIVTGTGLGMSITKQLTELMGGTISVVSRQNKGTSTTIKIPFRETSVKTTLRDLLGQKRLIGYNVLVADDNEISREIMKELLTLAGCNAICVSSGEEVISLVRDNYLQDEAFDIIILDYIMTGLNGLETALEMKRQTPGYSAGNTKLLMVSAYTRQLIADEINSAGFSNIIEKPFSPISFIQKLYSGLEVEQDIPKANDIIKLDGFEVLLCEDNEMNQEVALSMLETFGINADVANNGKEALDMLDKKCYDIVLMDIIMPIMNGHEATKLIRSSNAPYKNIPIIAMTANVVKEEIDICLEEGMNGHIGKPINYDVLGIQLKKWLNRENKSDNSDKQPMSAERSRKDKMFIEGIDTEKGIARFAGKKERYLNILLKFATNLPETFLPFEEATSEEKIKELAEQVHTLKGVSGNLEILPIYNAAVEFEKTMRTETPDKNLYNQLNEITSLMKTRIINACQTTM